MQATRVGFDRSVLCLIVFPQPSHLGHVLIPRLRFVSTGPPGPCHYDLGVCFKLSLLLLLYAVHNLLSFEWTWFVRPGTKLSKSQNELKSDLGVYRNLSLSVVFVRTWVLFESWMTDIGYWSTQSVHVSILWVTDQSPVWGTLHAVPKCSG